MPSALSLPTPARRAVGLAGLGEMPPPKPEQVLDYQVAAAAAATVAARASAQVLPASIGAGVALSVGLTLGWSGRGNAQTFGWLCAGAGAVLGALAVRSYMTSNAAIEVRDAFAKPLLAAGHPVPGVPEIQLDKVGP